MNKCDSGTRRRFTTPAHNPSNTSVARTDGYTHAANVRALCIVQGPVSVAPCQTLIVRFAVLHTHRAV
jgi:hypothetical protein